MRSRASMSGVCASRRRFVAGIAGVSLAGAAAARDDASRTRGFVSLAISPPEWSLGYRLPDLMGRHRTPADFVGKVSILFFGYLACPAICPSTMYELAQIRAATGDLRQRVQIVFATLDPERDSAPAMRRWLDGFDPQAIGLRGAEQEIAAATAALKLTNTRVPGRRPGSYTIDHGVQAYVYDPAGRLRLLIRPGPTVQDVADDISILLRGST